MGQEDETSHDLQVPTATAADRAYQAIKALFSAAPYVGGPLAELFGLVITPSLEKRRVQFFEAIVEELRRLQAADASFNVEELVTNESFVTAVYNATRVVVGTHQRKKHEALRNAVLNVATGAAPDDSTTALFINLIDRFTPLHLTLLSFLHGGAPVRDLARRNMRARLCTEPIAALAECNSDFKAAGYELHDLLLEDLRSTRLVRWQVDDSTGRVNHFNLGDSFTTELGKRFLAFVSAPLPAAASGEAVGEAFLGAD